MSDLKQGGTMTELYDFISAGSAHTFTFNFNVDKVVFVNTTAWTGTAGKLPISTWYKRHNTTAYAYQQQVVDTAAAQSFNFINATSNGFTPANTAGGVATSHCTISGITAASPGVITHSAFTFQTNQIVRITDLGNVGVSDRGMGQLNNNRYQVVVLTSTTLSLIDIATGVPVDTTAFTAYVSGGRLTLETHVLTLNNPQVLPYSATSPYNPDQYAYDPVTYKLTAGTAVMGSASDVFIIEAYKFGQYTNLGQL